MKISPLRCTCRKCARVFDAEVVTEAEISITLASMKAVRCPSCGAGSGSLSIGGAHHDPPPLSAAVEDRANWWKERGDVGLSSQTIWSVLTGTAIAEPAVPADTGDFARCCDLLSLIPEWAPRLPEVADQYPWWQPFVLEWPSLQKQLDFIRADTAKTKAPGEEAQEALYRQIQLLCVDSQRLRHSRSGVSTDDRGHLSSISPQETLSK